MIKYIIVDDEHIAHDIIKGYGDLLPYMVWQQSCYDAIEALAFLQDHTIDLIFLDLNMPKLKGFDFIRTLTHRPKIIVTTAYSEFALEGYELDIVDYLLKPFGFERFLKAVNKYQSLAAPSLDTSVTAIVSEEPNTFFIKSDKKHYQVNVLDILFLEAAGNYTKVITTEDIILTRETISNLLSTLPSPEFVKVHKSFAVAKRHINSIEGNLIHIKDHQVPIGKMYRLNVQDMLRE